MSKICVLNYTLCFISNIFVFNLLKYKYYSKIQTIHKEFNHTPYKKVGKTLLSYPHIPE